MKNKKYDYLVVGAGLSGAVFANLMSNCGKKVLVLDKRKTIGGNCASKMIKGIEVHSYGPHIFRTNDYFVWSYLDNIAKFNTFINSPIANYKGEIFNLPFNMNTFNKLWDTATPKEAKEKIKSQVIENKNPNNLEEYVLSLAGTDIYEKLIKGYTEKQWKKKCTDLPISTMKRIPFRFNYDNNYYKEKYQGIPEKGYNYLFKELLKNCDIKLNTDYNKNRDKYNNMANKIFYTGSIDELFDFKFGILEYRTLKFRTEKLPIENFQGNAVVNYTDYNIPYTRITEHKHFKNVKSNFTIITKEYPSEWNKSKERYYPINDKKNRDIYNKYLHLANRNSKLILSGRLAEYKYYDMNDIVLRSINKYISEISNEKF